LRVVQVEVPEGVIDLGVGQPDASVYPVELFRRAAVACFGEGAPIDHYQYGAEYGDGLHRLALADFLGAAYGFPVDPELLFTTNGNSQALDMVCTVFTRPGDVVVVEEPTYFLAGGIFADHGLEVVGVPIDQEGLDPEQVDGTLTRLAREGRQARFVYTIPAFHNPTGATISEDRRSGLVEVASRHGVMVLADEVYHMLGFDPLAQIPPAMSRWVDSGVVLSLGTFSKILAPGLRLGWLHASADKVKAMANSGVVVSGGGLNPIPSRLVTEVMTSGDLASNIAMLSGVYAARAATMQQALEVSMSEGVSWATPHGGYYFWLTPPSHLDASALRSLARTMGVDFRPGSLFSSRGGLAHHIRLSFAFYREDEIGEGVTRLGQALLHADYGIGHRASG
jgi:DNA-binding transcriptional MocR family regulator